MVQIENTIVSFDIFEKKFCCNLPSCLGKCCVEGDSGAPLEDDEVDFLENNIDAIEPYLTKIGRELIEVNGVFVIDIEGDKVTPINKGKECAYAIFENNICKCAIEKAWIEKKITFQKPLSCHLYPIRVSTYPRFDALNYNTWAICNPAVINGKNQQIPLFIFLKDPLIRKYGEKWYNELLNVAKELETSKFLNREQ